MCGIAAWIKKSHSYSLDNDTLKSAANTIQHRGPDRSKTLLLNEARLDFHRLCINGIDESSDQPFSTQSDWHLICNGEIYNYKMLSECHPIQSNSDCEVIIRMLDGGMNVGDIAASLDGVFAFFAVNPTAKKAVAARDLYGVRGLYYADHPNLSFAIASELKALHSAKCTNIKPFQPNTWLEIDYSNLTDIQMQWGHFNHPFLPKYYRSVFTNENRCIRAIQQTLKAAVKKRIMSDRLPIGCFLSGGFDSSIVAALLVEQLNNPKDLHTFSIGMKGGTDLKFAKEVAEHLGTTHHEVVVTEKEMLDALPHALQSMETFDTTTVRAGTGMWLLSQWIAKHSDVRVIFSGEGADELSGSYLYFRMAPSAEAYHNECLRLCKDLHRFDVLRADQSTASAGLEVRVPFLDKAFTNLYLHVDPELRRPRDISGKQIEKYLLRKSFEHYLPSSVAWRIKEAFSDGVSSNTKSWFEIIQDHVSTLDVQSESYEYLPPMIPESQWYRKVFQDLYPGCENVIPYYWLPLWSGDVQDPSARVLSTYDAK